MLDIGSHWLHQAALYALDGYDVIGAEMPEQQRAVVPIAEELSIKTISYRGLEDPDALNEVESDSVDVILFAETLEHLAFNPIPMWRGFYRVLKPGGRVIVTAPNMYYHESMRDYLAALQFGFGIKPSIFDMMLGGNGSHHWKEYSLYELFCYFRHLSPDFETTKAYLVDPVKDDYFDATRIQDTLGDEPLTLTPHFVFFHSSRPDTKHPGLFFEVTLRQKSAGIVPQPQW